MKSNALNFSGGPGALPPCVLDKTQEAVVALPETGLSVLGMSHRSEWFIRVLDEAERNIRELLGLHGQYAVSFLQGGSSLLFATIPQNLATRAFAAPEYVNSGYWSSRATSEAKRVGACQVAWDGAQSGFRDLPTIERLGSSARILASSAPSAGLPGSTRPSFWMM